MTIDWNFDAIAVHHIGDNLSANSSAVEAKHMQQNGWDDIGYHYMIHPDGRFFEGRKLGYKGAHVRSANTGKIGVLMMGDYDHQWWDPSDDALDSAHVGKLRSLIQTLRGFFCIQTLGGHSEFPNQGDGCPGNQLLPQVTARRSEMGLGAP